MAADDLATQGAKASATVISTEVNQDDCPHTLRCLWNEAELVTQYKCTSGYGGCKWFYDIQGQCKIANCTLRSTEIEGEYTGFTLSVCGQNRVHSVPSTILAGSIAYLHILATNFRRCVACWVLWKFSKFEILAISLNLHLWLGIQYESVVWVIMGWQGYPQNVGVLVSCLNWGRIST